MDLNALPEESSLPALCYLAMGNPRPHSCSVSKVTQQVRSAIFSSSGFLVSHSVLAKSTAYCNHYCCFSKGIMLVFLKKGALSMWYVTLNTGLKATASSKVIVVDEANIFSMSLLTLGTVIQR